MIFFEIPGLMLSTLEPFLAQLQRVEPALIPFQKYIAASTASNFDCSIIDPPQYARNPQFSYNLSSLLPSGEELTLNATDSDSITQAKEILKKDSTLDPSQVEALVDSLTRELAMIEG